MNDDFVTEIETAFLSRFEQNQYLAQYNWQRWDSDAQVELPRGAIVVSGVNDPLGTPIYRLSIELRFEGRPKKTKLSVVMNELKNLLQARQPPDFNTSRVQFFGRYAENVSFRRTNVSGLRTWYISFVLYGMGIP